MKNIHNVTNVDLKVYYNEADTQNDMKITTEENLDVNPSSSVSLESLDGPSFDGSNESCGWRFDDLDPHVMEMIEENLDALDARTNDISEIEADLWVQSPTIPIGEFSNPHISIYYQLKWPVQDSLDFPCDYLTSGQF